MKEAEESFFKSSVNMAIEIENRKIS